MELTKADARNMTPRKVIEDKPFVLMGSQSCTNWSTLMNINWDRMDPEVVEERNRVARVHLEFCAKHRRLQHDAGRYFLHERPNSSSSRHEQVIT